MENEQVNQIQHINLTDEYVNGHVINLSKIRLKSSFETNYETTNIFPEQQVIISLFLSMRVTLVCCKTLETVNELTLVDSSGNKLKISKDPICSIVNRTKLEVTYLFDDLSLIKLKIVNNGNRNFELKQMFFALNIGEKIVGLQSYHTKFIENQSILAPNDIVFNNKEGIVEIREVRRLKTKVLFRKRIRLKHNFEKEENFEFDEHYKYLKILDNFVIVVYEKHVMIFEYDSRTKKVKRRTDFKLDIRVNFVESSSSSEEGEEENWEDIDTDQETIAKTKTEKLESDESQETEEELSEVQEDEEEHNDSESEDMISSEINSDLEDWYNPHSVYFDQANERLFIYYGEGKGLLAIMHHVWSENRNLICKKVKKFIKGVDEIRKIDAANYHLYGENSHMLVNLNIKSMVISKIRLKEEVFDKNLQFSNCPEDILDLSENLTFIKTDDDFLLANLNQRLIVKKKVYSAIMSTCLVKLKLPDCTIIASTNEDACCLFILVLKEDHLDLKARVYIETVEELNQSSCYKKVIQIHCLEDEKTKPFPKIMVDILTEFDYAKLEFNNKLEFLGVKKFIDCNFNEINGYETIFVKENWNIYIGAWPTDSDDEDGDEEYDDRKFLLKIYNFRSDALIKSKKIILGENFGMFSDDSVFINDYNMITYYLDAYEGENIMRRNFKALKITKNKSSFKIKPFKVRNMFVNVGLTLPLMKFKENKVYLLDFSNNNNQRFIYILDEALNSIKTVSILDQVSPSFHLKAEYSQFQIISENLLLLNSFTKRVYSILDMTDHQNPHINVVFYDLAPVSEQEDENDIGFCFFKNQESEFYYYDIEGFLLENYGIEMIVGI